MPGKVSAATARLASRPTTMGYHLHQRATNEPTRHAHDVARWGAALETGSAPQRQAALRRLVDARAEEVLTRYLASTSAPVVQLAAAGLWECWLDEAGSVARDEIDGGIDAMNEGDLARAFKVFVSLIDRFPNWAEAVNKLATVLYLQNKPEASIVRCQQAVALKPDHFGAWNGLALCAVQIEDWRLARRAVGESLRLQPHSPTNRQLLYLVESRLAQE